MANNKDFKVKNGIQATTYREKLGTVTSSSEGYILSSASYDNITADISSESTNARSVRFKTDGTKMYVLNGTNDTVYQYALSTAWDVSTASYESKSFSTTGQEANPYGLFFKSDGTKMYIMGATDALYQYTLSTAWDVSTASYDSVSFSVASQHTNAYVIYFSSDGDYFYITGNTPDTVFQYNMSTAWDLSTASYSSNSFIHTQSTFPIAVAFNNDGTKMYVANGSSTYLVYQYSLSTAWDVSTASYDNISFDLAQSAFGYSLYSFTFGKDGDKLYAGYNSGGNIYQYSTALITKTLDLSTGSVFEIDTPIGIKIDLSNPAPSGTVSKATLLVSGTGGLDTSENVPIYENMQGAIKESYLGGSPTITSQVFFKPDGTKMYVTSQGYGTNQYSLKIPWDIRDYSSVTLDGYFNTDPEDTAMMGLWFKPDGTKVYYVGYTNDNVYQYSLSSPWNILTASYDSVSFSVSAQELTPQFVTFSTDGTEMYVAGITGDDVNQYTLSTAWDISTASYTRVQALQSPSNVYGVQFNSDGTEMYVAEQNQVERYTLSTAWDISTITYQGIWSYNLINNRSIFIRPDQTKMYAAQQLYDGVIRYDMGLASPLSFNSAVEWGVATAPTEVRSGETKVLTFSTRNGGTSYNAAVAIDGVYKDV